MFTFISKLPWIVKIPVAIGLLVLFFWLFGQVQACGYKKARAEYQKDRDQWINVDRPKLIAEAEAKEKRIAELEPQLAIYKDAAEKGKKIDEAKQQQIEDVTKREAENEKTANLPTDCRSRANRLCDLFRTNDKRFDCKLFFDECAGQ